MQITSTEEYFVVINKARTKCRTLCLNSIGAFKTSALISQPFTTQILCFLIASTSLVIVVVDTTVGLLTSPWQHGDIRLLHKNLVV